MARRYFTIPHFVQNIDIDLLDTYFKQASIPFPENLKTTDDDGKPNASKIDSYINSLDKEVQKKIIKDFIDINELSYEGGILSIMDVANVSRTPVQAELGELEGYVNQAMYSFLNHTDIFQKASEIAYFERLSSKTIIYGLLKKKIEDVSNENIKNALEIELKKYFRKKDGRGKNCTVDIITYKDKVFYRALPQDFSQLLFDHDENGQLRKNVVHPVFEVVFIYYHNEGKLELSARFRNKRRNELVNIFNKVVLKDNSTIKDGKKAYDFNRLLSLEFVMPVKSEDKVSWAYLKQLRLNYRYVDTKKVTLEIDDKDTKGAEAIHAMIKELGLNTEQLNVTQATFKVKFEGAGNKGSVTATITSPDKCNLKTKPTHQKVKEYLKYWGLGLSDNEKGN
jgi:hypothetical protein